MSFDSQLKLLLTSESSIFISLCSSGGSNSVLHLFSLYSLISEFLLLCRKQFPDILILTFPQWNYDPTYLARWVEVSHSHSCLAFDRHQSSLVDINIKFILAWDERKAPDHHYKVTFFALCIIFSIKLVNIDHLKRLKAYQTMLIEIVGSNTVEPWYNKGPVDWQSMFAITRFRYMEFFFFIYFTITGARNIVHYTEDFVTWCI